MEWHKAKNIMLALLVLVNLILLGSRIYITGTERREQLAAAQGAVDHLRSRDIELDVSLIPPQSLSRSLCVIPRERAAEQALAQALLPGAQLQASGSSDRYRADSGEVTWRHGGQLEAGVAALPSLDALAQLLDGSVCLDDRLMQTIDGLPVFNCTLSFTDAGTLSGRWCFGEPELLDEQTELSAAGLLIRYASGPQALRPSRITALVYGYAVQSVPNLGVRLVPVLRLTVEPENEPSQEPVHVYLDALTGDVMIVE